jgi:hypothetical protein
VKNDATCGWEVASYKGRGIGDINNVSRCLATIAQNGGVINKSCGLHVHAEVIDYNEKDIARVVASWMRIEYIISQIVPKWRTNNIYCRMLREKHAKKLCKKNDQSYWGDWDFYFNITPSSYFDGIEERRVSLNICNYRKSRIKPDFDRFTIELRLPEMTSSADDIRNWIKLFLVFTENAIKFPVPGNMKSVSLPKALAIIGLHPFPGKGFILSEGLFRIKEWFLHRILKYSSDIKLCYEAVTMLNNMWFPLREYTFDERTGKYNLGRGNV